VRQLAEVVRLVTGLVEPDRTHDVVDREALRDGPPQDLEQTFLLKGREARWPS